MLAGEGDTLQVQKGYLHRPCRACSGHSMQWMQYTVDTVHSRIVVHGNRDIVFGAERSNQWMQWMQYAVE